MARVQIVLALDNKEIFDGSLGEEVGLRVAESHSDHVLENRLHAIFGLGRVARAEATIEVLSTISLGQADLLSHLTTHGEKDFSIFPDCKDSFVNLSGHELMELITL